MNTSIHNFCRNNIMLVIVGLLMVGAFSYIFVFASEVNPNDTDGDGILNEADYCPNTVLVDKPGDTWGVNRYLWIGEDNFMVYEPGKGGKQKVFSEFSMAQTKGCSCLDIVKASEKKSGIEHDINYKNGCSKATIEGWIKEMNQL